jgi:hypothetical protein
MSRILDAVVNKMATDSLVALENRLKSDVIFFYGPIQSSIVKIFRDFLENLKKDEFKNKRLSIILNTPGGSAEAVEKLVVITRFFYEEVDFIVPDYAMSAGTIFCMSGDRIFMDYASSLGPIDPQVQIGSNWVPALGYLDKVAELIEKSRNNTLTQAEFLMLKEQDLAMLNSYEQSRDLTISLLKDWLVKYKFKNWEKHESSPDKKGQPVRVEEKENRAEEVAKILGNNKMWLSHGRSIGIDVLRKTVKLKIEDYSEDAELKNLIRSYNDLICDYIARMNYPNFFHSRNYF